MLKYLTHKLRTQSINDENHANEKIDGHDSGTESDGDLEQEDDLIQEHEMELSLSSRQDTASPTDTACSSESPAFLGPSSSHLLLYDQNSSEEELEVINGGAVGSCDIIEVGSVSGVPARVAGGAVITGGIGVAVIDHAHSVDEDEDDEDDPTEEIVEDDADEGEDEAEEEEEEEEEEDDGDYVAPPAAVPAATPMAMATATTIIGSAIGAMDTSNSGSSSSSSSSNNNSISKQFVPLGGATAAASDETQEEDIFDRGEPLDDFSDELSSLTATVSSLPAAGKGSSLSGGGKRFSSVSSLLEKRKRSLAHNSDDEVRLLLEQQQQQQQLPTPLHHHHQHHQHHHHHHSLRQPDPHPEDALLSAPVNFRTSPPLEALKPHRGHIIQRSTTPLVLSESGGSGGGIGVAAGTGILLSVGSGASGFYGTGSGGGGGGGSGSGLVPGAGGLRFGLGRRPIGCDSPLSAVSHRNSTNQPHGGGSGVGSGLSTTTSTRTSSSSTSSLSSSSSLARLAGGCSPGLDSACSNVLDHHHHQGGFAASLVTNMDVSRSVSPPAKMFHCAVSPRRRQSRHQQHQRLQRPHRPCLDFDKMQQLKARSVTTWRHSNEHSGELSVFCW